MGQGDRGPGEGVRERSNMISRRGGGSKILEKCEDHYIKSHQKCEDGGEFKIVKNGVRSYLIDP